MIDAASTTVVRPMPDDWVEDWFGEEYLAVYEHREHRDQREARAVVRLIAERMGERPDAIGDLGRTFVERVRLFEPPELLALCTAAGFAVESLLGDYVGGPLSASSPRAIVMARRR